MTYPLVKSIEFKDMSALTSCIAGDIVANDDEI